MNYIYDIFLNFQSELYDFFEWNYDDKITHIRKIPVFRINPNDFLKLKNSFFRINNDFKEKIHNKTECFNQRKVTTIEYACLFTNAIEVVAILFDKEGRSIKYSNLFIDENTEVIEVCEQLNEECFSYIVNNKKQINNYTTRKDREIIKYIKNEFNLLIKNNENDKLKYLYYECFNKKENRINIVINEFKKWINNYNISNYMKVYDVLKMKPIKK